jgi:hypothetical protein
MRAQQRTGQQTGIGRGGRDIGAIAALHMDAIARGGWALSFPRGGGERRAIVIVGVTGILDGDACIASPIMGTAA